MRLCRLLPQAHGLIRCSPPRLRCAPAGAIFYRLLRRLVDNQVTCRACKLMGLCFEKFFNLVGCCARAVLALHHAPDGGGLFSVAFIRQ